MSEQKKPAFNMDFITQALGLLPIQCGTSAINISAITGLYMCEDGQSYTLTLHDGEKKFLTCDDMVELEQTIKARAEAAAIIQKEAFKQQLKAQADAMAELQSGVAPGMIVGAPVGKRFRH